MKRLGIDLGKRHIGVSIHDDDDLPARALCTLEVRSERDAIARVKRLVAHESPAELVVGLPLTMKGDEGPAARAAQRFADALRGATKIPATLWDERLTTTQARRARVARGVKGRDGIDAEAATILLQSYVDAKRGGSGWSPDEP